MARSINRNDPAYQEAMREAKALFDAAMQKSAMKGRGRPAAAAPTPPVEDPVESDAELTAEIEAEASALAQAGTEAEPEPEAEPEAEPAPPAPATAARRPRATRRPKRE